MRSRHWYVGSVTIHNVISLLSLGWLLLISHKFGEMLMNRMNGEPSFSMNGD